LPAGEYSEIEIIELKYSSTGPPFSNKFFIKVRTGRGRKKTLRNKEIN